MTSFVTFRLAGSIPHAVLEEWARQQIQLETELARLGRGDERKRRELEFQRQRFARLEKYLDKALTGPTWLTDERIAQVVADSLHYRDAKVYRLEAYCIMPNHVHTVFTPLPVAQADSLCHAPAQADNSGHGDGPPDAQADSLCYHSLASIMHSLEGYTAHEANQLLGRKGAFWEHESYDHYVRDDQELDRIIAYVLNNPLKAGLVTTDWKAWPWSYCRVPL